MLVIAMNAGAMKRPSKLPPIELVEAEYSYDPETGFLIRNKTGTPIGTNDRSTGYIKARVGRLSTQVARIAWLLFYREDPVNYRIEHINGCKQDNRIENLRKVKLPRRRSRRYVSECPNEEDT